jgi:hypothetical protein
LLLFFCESALPAADFDALLVRPSLSVFDAAVAASLDVDFDGAFVCERALPAADFDFALVDLLERVSEALEAAVLPVTLLPAI